MSIIRNRELSQFGSFLYIDDSVESVSITEGSPRNVGIGSTIPKAKLDILGNVKISGIVTATSFSGTFTGTASSATVANYATIAGVSTIANGISGNSSLKTTGIITASAFYIGNNLLLNPDFQTWFFVDPINSETSNLYRINGNVGIGRSTNITEKLTVNANVSASRFISTVSTASGSAPFSVSSTNLVTNLNADFLGGKSAPSGNIVGTTDSQVLTNKTLTTPIIQSGGATFNGSSGSTILRASSVASGTLTLPTQTGTLISSGGVGVITSTNILNGTIINEDISSSASIAISKLAASTISGVSLGSNLGNLSRGNYITYSSGTTYNGSSAITIGVAGTTANISNTLVARDASGNFTAGTISCTNLSVTTGDISGSLENTLTLQTSGGYLTGSTTYDNSSSTTFTVGLAATSSNTANRVVARDSSGNFTAGTITANVTGTATTATRATTVDTTETTTGTHYLTFVDSASSTSGETIRVDSGLSYDATLNTLTATNFNGGLLGNATSADTVDTTETTTGTHYLTFVDSASSTSGETIRVDSGLSYDASIGTLISTNFNSTSDINLKTNIRQIENSLNKVRQIRGVHFDWKKDNRPSVGVIAQEVEKVLPELVTTAENKSVNYNGLIGVLIEAIKELSSEVEELKKKNT